jgi:hypothetical protein
MKLTKSQLKQIIKEELTNVLNEFGLDMRTGKAIESPPGNLGSLLSQVLDISANIEDAEEYAESNPEVLETVVKSSQAAISAMYKSLEEPRKQEVFIKFVERNTPEKFYFADTLRQGALEL